MVEADQERWICIVIDLHHDTRTYTFNNEASTLMNRISWRSCNNMTKQGLEFYLYVGDFLLHHMCNIQSKKTNETFQDPFAWKLWARWSTLRGKAMHEQPCLLCNHFCNKTTFRKEYLYVEFLHLQDMWNIQSHNHSRTTFFNPPDPLKKVYFPAYIGQSPICWSVDRYCDSYNFKTIFSVYLRLQQKRKNMIGYECLPNRTDQSNITDETNTRGRKRYHSKISDPTFGHEMLMSALSWPNRTPKMLLLNFYASTVVVLRIYSVYVWALASGAPIPRFDRI